jgi:hypothetical protein
MNKIMLKYEGMELRAIFDIIQDKNPGLSTLICFSKAIAKRKYEPEYITKWFKKLVDKEDYEHRDRDEVLKWLQKYTLNSTEKVTQNHL